jgi:lantibiotic biosynthesis protein
MKAASGPSSDARDNSRVRATTLRYLIRASTRCTPFGAFAAQSYGRIGERTHLAVNGSNLRRYARLSSQVLHALCATILKSPEALLAFPVRCNPTLRSSSKTYTFVEYHTDGMREFAFAQAEISRNQPIDAVVSMVHASSATGEDAAQSLAAAGHDIVAARDFVSTLIRSQLLVSAMRPNTLGPDALDAIHDQLTTYYPQSTFTDIVASCRRHLNAINATALGEGEAVAELETLLRESDLALPDGSVVHVDLFRDGNPTLSSETTRAIASAVEVMNRLSVTSRLSVFLSDLTDAFKSRFGDRDVPLLDVVDPSFGLLPEASVPDGSVKSLFASALRPAVSTPLQASTVLLLKLIERARVRGDRCIDLEDAAVDQLPAPLRPLPSSYAVFASVLNNNESKAPSLLIRSVNRTASAPFGRFAYADHRITEGMTELASNEQLQSPDTMFAEIDMVSGPRSANVNTRPVTLPFVLPTVFARGESPQVLDLSTLSLRVSENRITLWHTEARREVVPRLTSMQGLHPSYDLRLLVLLHALQARGGADYLGAEFLWGPLWNELQWLPRVTFGQIVIAREQWRFSLPKHESDQHVETALRAFLVALAVPRWVLLTDRDQELLVDCESEWGIRELLREHSVSKVLRLQERLCTDSVTDTDGHQSMFANEIVVPYTQELTPVAPSVGRSSGIPFGAFLKPVGSEWLYLKAYAGSRVQSMAVELLGNAANEMMLVGRIDRWHFLRYADRAPHLRFRVRLRDRAAWADTFTQLSGLLAHLQCEKGLTLELAQYEPEVARYGGQIAQDATERIFTTSSALALQLIAGRNTDPRERENDTVLAVGQLDWLLHVVSVGGVTPREVVTEALSLYRRMTPQLPLNDAERAVGSSYRALKQAMLHRGSSFDMRARFEEESSHLIAAHVEALRSDASAAQSALSADGLTTPMRWALDVAHMHCNRMFEQPSPAQEYYTYCLLERQMRMRAARASA